MQLISRLPFKREQDIPRIRVKAQQIAIWLDLSIWDQARIITAASETVWTIFRHCGEGVVDCGLIDEQEHHNLQFVVRSLDGGQLQAIADELDAVRSLVDRFVLRSNPEGGIEVVIGKSLSPGSETILPQSIEDWERELTIELPTTPFDDMRQRNQELLQLLAQLQDKEAALEQQLRETRRLEKARDELIHTMIHDLRNPLTSVQTSLSGLMVNDKEELSDYQRGMIEIAYQGTKKTVALVENILDVSRLEDNRIPLEYAPVSLVEVIGEVLQFQSLLAMERNIRLEKNVSPLLPAVYGDRKVIERVLQNLVDNALKFTPPGGFILVEAGSQSAVKDGERIPAELVTVSVQDSGTGIPDEIKGRLFEKFVTGSQKGRGIGLGLAFCKLAVEAHGGQILEVGEPGHGARFTFTLPMTTREKRHMEQRPPPEKLGI